MNKKKYVIKMVLISAVTVAVSLFAACTCDSKSSTGPISTNMALDLVNGATDAWLDMAYGSGDRTGFMFTSRGTFRPIIDGADGVGYLYTSDKDGGVLIKGAALDSLEVLSDVALYTDIVRGVAVSYEVTGVNPEDTLTLKTADRSYKFLRVQDVVVTGVAEPGVPYKSRD